MRLLPKIQRMSGFPVFGGKGMPELARNDIGLPRAKAANLSE
jgi:hypothetical protein